MTYPIVGDFFRPPAKAILQVLPMGCPLWLQPEPDNDFDSNAVKVLVKSVDLPQDQYDNLDVLAAPFGFSLEEILAQESWHLGYVPRTMAVDLASKLAGETVEAKLAFTRNGKPSVEYTP